jgi:hypothetical protein
VLFDHRPELGVVLPRVAVQLVHDEIVERVLRPVPQDRAASHQVSAGIDRAWLMTRSRASRNAGV